MSERAQELAAAVRDLDPDERAEFERLVHPEDDPPDYETPIVLKTPVDLGGGRTLDVIKATRRPGMADFVSMKKDIQRGTDEASVLLHVCTQLTGVPNAALLKLDVDDAAELINRLGDWLRPFIDSRR